MSQQGLPESHRLTAIAAAPPVGGMLAAAAGLASRGLRVFPVHSVRADGLCTCNKSACKDRGKHPRVKEWQVQATTDIVQVTAWWTKWPDANVGVATGRGWTVIDLDGPDQAEAFAAVARQHGGLSPTLASRTGRGLHLWLRGDVGPSRTVNFLHDQVAGRILVRGDGGYVVAPPSLHRSGVRYAWLNAVPPAPIPDWLTAWATTAGETRAASMLPALGPVPQWINGSAPPVTAPLAPWTPAEEARILQALAAVPATCGRDEWLHVGMALHALRWERPDGTDRGYEMWAEWSATGGDKYLGEHDLETRWRSFGKRSGVTLGTLFHIAEQRGWRAAPLEHREEVVPPGRATGHTQIEATPLPAYLLAGADIPAGTLGAESEVSPGYVNGSGGHLNGHAAPLPPALTAPGPSPLIDLNAQYACIGDVGGKCLVLGWVSSKADPTVQVPSFQSFKSFGERYGNRYVQVARPGEEAEPKPLGQYWLKWRHRRSYDAVDMIPGGAPEVGSTLNLWRGWGVEPREGKWERMRAHVAEVLAGGDSESDSYIIKWAAWAVQNPGRPAEAALVFRGTKRGGKGTFAHALRRLFGSHGFHCSDSRHLVGSFNAHLRTCLLLFADEAFWAGDKRGESVLKALITEPTIVIEQKGVDAVQWRNQVHLVMAANAEWVVPVSHDEMRYAVFSIDERRAAKAEWFDPLHRELEEGGLAAMLWDLQRLDLAGWHPRKIVRTAALREQQRRSMDPRYEWLESVLQEGKLPRPANWPSDVAPAGNLLGHARDFAPRLREATGTAIGRFLAEQGCLKIHRAEGNAWRFPPLAEMRERWEARWRGWDWERVIGEWQ